jgi:hypothetical protein
MLIYTSIFFKSIKTTLSSLSTATTLNISIGSSYKIIFIYFSDSKAILPIFSFLNSDISSISIFLIERPY